MENSNSGSLLSWSRRIRTKGSMGEFEVVIKPDGEGYYVASVPQLAGCHTQAKSLHQVTIRIREAIEICIEVEGRLIGILSL